MAESQPVATKKQTLDPPPIFKLDHYMFWQIFTLNANMEQDTEKSIPALNTLRYASQVCSGWREFILGSPSLWARVVNIRALKQESDQWRTEVIRRSGKALLRIKTVHEVNSMEIMEFLEKVLDEHWPRIQSLHIEVDFNRKFHNGRWRCLFERPAPLLEAFKYSNDEERNLKGKDFLLFANDAPSLRTLDAADIKPYLATLSAPNLRHLVLHPWFCTTMELLGALSRMPLLEILEANPYPSHYLVLRKNDMQLSGLLPQVTLPRLKDITFDIPGGLDAILLLLAHIIPANSCALYLRGRYTNEFPSDHESLPLCRDILSRYSQYCTELKAAGKLTVRVGKLRFRVSAPLSFGRCFSFSIINESRFPEPTMIESVARLGINNVQNLKLEIDASNTALSASSNIAELFFSLASVERLETNPQTLDFIQKNLCGGDMALPFPTLNAIRLGAKSRQSELYLVKDFVESRTRMGHSLTMTVGPSRSVNFKTLKNIPGLVLQILH